MITLKLTKKDIALILMAVLCAALIGWNTMLQLQINQNRHWMVHESHSQSQINDIQTKTITMILDHVKKKKAAKPPCLAVPKFEY